MTHIHATTRYKFKVDLFVEESNEYKEVEEELLNEFHINESFDNEGNIFLKFDDIYRGLDAVIHKKFKDKIEREKGIAAILKLKSLSVPERVENFFKHAGYQIFCSEQTHHRLLITPNDVPFNLLNAYLEKLNYHIKEYKGEFKVINNGEDITKNKKLNKKHKIFFGDHSTGHIFPQPQNNVFTVFQREDWELSIFGDSLIRIYGQGRKISGVDFRQLNQLI